MAKYRCAERTFPQGKAVERMTYYNNKEVIFVRSYLKVGFLYNEGL